MEARVCTSHQARHSRDAEKVLRDTRLADELLTCL